jgi:hypothetical protein
VRCISSNSRTAGEGYGSRPLFCFPGRARKFFGTVSRSGAVSVIITEGHKNFTEALNMANKLPWTTPKVQTLYTTSSVGRLIAEYLDAGGQMLQMREGVLGDGDVLLYDDAGKLKTYVIREVAINEWSSGHKVRGYNRIPEKYRALLDK